MKRLLTGLLVTILLFTVSCIVIPSIPETPDMPSYEVKAGVDDSSWDCDDVALVTLLALEAEGYEAIIVIGNLEIINETFDQCNHIWIIVEVDGIGYHYENYKPYFIDKQHNEGIIVTKEFLILAVAGDYL